MSRRRAAIKKEILPDAKYGDTVLAKFINVLQLWEVMEKEQLNFV